MADFVFNCAKGRAAYYATLPASNDGLVLVVLEASGLETDSTLKDYDDLATLLAGTSNEQTTMGRKAATSVTVTVNDSTDVAAVDIADVTWSAATGNATGKLLVCYDPDTTTGTDSSLIPLTAHDFTVTPDGSDVIVTINASGIFTAA